MLPNNLLFVYIRLTTGLRKSAELVLYLNPTDFLDQLAIIQDSMPVFYIAARYFFDSNRKDTRYHEEDTWMFMEDFK